MIGATVFFYIMISWIKFAGSLREKVPGCCICVVNALFVECLGSL